MSAKGQKRNNASEPVVHAELSAELSLVRRARLLLRHCEKFFGNALGARWRSGFDVAAHSNGAHTDALMLISAELACVTRNGSSN
jgi:hypothetical protein